MLLPCTCWEVLSGPARRWPLCLTADKAYLPCSLVVRGSPSTSAWHAAVCAAAQALSPALCAPAGRTPCQCQTPSSALCRRPAPTSGVYMGIRPGGVLEPSPLGKITTRRPGVWARDRHRSKGPRPPGD